jgi:hypothetical protein
MATEIGNEGYLELGEMDGVWVRFTQDGVGIDGGCRGPMVPMSNYLYNVKYK